MAAESSFQTLKMIPSSSEKTTFSKKVEQRAVIKFGVDIGKTPTETHKFIKRPVTHSNVSRSLVFKWHNRFSDGIGSLIDDKREGRPSFKTSDVVKNEVRDVIDGDRRLTVREVVDKCVISKTTVHEILVQELHMNRICARWVPRMLSEENMTNRTEASRQFLRKFSQSGIGFLDRIITTDEAWFHYYDPETKQQSSQWKNVDSPRSKIDLLEFQCLKHPLYSPDLAPMDFAVFPYIKSFLRGMRFDNLSELRQAVMNVIFHMKTDQFVQIFND
jgi:histone-lysine N-methyltransferase SETMAR